MMSRLAWGAAFAVLATSIVTTPSTAGADRSFARVQSSLIELANRYTNAIMQATATGAAALRARKEALPVSLDLIPLPGTLSRRLQLMFPEFLPNHDAYGRPLLYWYDGGDVVFFISRGPDGKLDRDYRRLWERGQTPLEVFCNTGTDAAKEDDVVWTDEGACRVRP